MATNHTTNYALNLWEPTDAFLREEFNENTQKIDAAVGALKSWADGLTATGTFRYTKDQDLEVDLGFRPRLVLMIGINYFIVASGNFNAQVYIINSIDRPYCQSSSNIQLTDTGFQILGGGIELHPNASTKDFGYFAIR